MNIQDHIDLMGGQLMFVVFPGSPDGVLAQEQMARNFNLTPLYSSKINRFRVCKTSKK